MSINRRGFLGRFGVLLGSLPIVGIAQKANAQQDAEKNTESPNKDIPNSVESKEVTFQDILNGNIRKYMKVKSYDDHKKLIDGLFSFKNPSDFTDDEMDRFCEYFVWVPQPHLCMVDIFRWMGINCTKQTTPRFYKRPNVANKCMSILVPTKDYVRPLNQVIKFEKYDCGQ